MALVRGGACGTARGSQVTQAHHQLGRCLASVAGTRQTILAQVRSSQLIGRARWQTCSNRAGNRLDIGVREVNHILHTARDSINTCNCSTDRARNHSDRKDSARRHARRHLYAMAHQGRRSLHIAAARVTAPSAAVARIGGVHASTCCSKVLTEPGQRCVISQRQRCWAGTAQQRQDQTHCLARLQIWPVGVTHTGDRIGRQGCVIAGPQRIAITGHATVSGTTRSVICIRLGRIFQNHISRCDIWLQQVSWLIKQRDVAELQACCCAQLQQRRIPGHARLYIGRSLLGYAPVSYTHQRKEGLARKYLFTAFCITVTIVVDKVAPIVCGTSTDGQLLRLDAIDRRTETGLCVVDIPCRAHKAGFIARRWHDVRLAR